MILNKTYYQKLLENFKDVKHLDKSFPNNIVDLTVKVILKHYYDNKPLHINFQNAKDSLCEIAKHLYIELANDIYKNHYDLPENYEVGEKLKRIKDSKYYKITRIINGNFTLTQLNSTTELTTDYDKLAKGYVKVEAGVRESTIKNYIKFFENLNNEKNEFLKLYFDKKTVFIAKKPLWDFLSERSKIPSVYLPNPNDGNDIHPIKSIPALSDCLCYFTPKYSLCYDNLLLKKINVKTIVVFDTEAINIQQMLLDKQRFGFNLIILSNSLTPQKNNSIPCWNWFKEEVELVNAL